MACCPIRREHTLTGTRAPESILLLSPHPNTEYRIDPNLDLSVQQIQIEAAAGQGVSEVTIWVDGDLLSAVSSPPYQAWWTLSPGEHRFWAEGMNAQGERVKSEVVVISVVK